MSAATLAAPDSESHRAATMSASDGVLAVQIAEMRSDVRHVQCDLVDIKADVRETRAKIDTVRAELSEKIDALRGELSTAKIWALGLYIALAGSMLFAMARGFKWI